MKRTTTSKRQLGQGMTEYIIIVALIAIGAIGVYTAFGKTVQHDVAGIAEGLAGNQTKATAEVTSAGTSADKADTEAKKTKGMDTFADDTQKVN